MRNVREALEPMVTIDDHDCNMIDADQIAPKIKAALETAYSEGYEDSERGLSCQPSTGVGMGILEFIVDAP